MMNFLKEKGLYEEFLEKNQIQLKSNEELINYFLDQNNFSEFTKEGYGLDIQFCIETMEVKNLQKVTSKTMFQYVKYLEKSEEFGVKRKKRLLASIRSFYKFYKKITKIFEDEFHFLEFPEFMIPQFKEKSAKVRSNKEVVLSLEEAKQFLKHLKLLNFKDYLISRLMLGSGMRIGDVINVEIGNIDFEKQKVRTMTKKGVRTYYFNKQTKEEILLYLRQRKQIAPEIPNLFIDRKGLKIKNKSYTRQFKRIVQKVGCHKNISCHSLRRSFSTIRSRLGQPKDEISFLLGHTIKNVTDDYIKKTDQEKLNIFLEYDFLEPF